MMPEPKNAFAEEEARIESYDNHLNLEAIEGGLRSIVADFKRRNDLDWARNAS